MTITHRRDVAGIAAGSTIVVIVILMAMTLFWLIVAINHIAIIVAEG